MYTVRYCLNISRFYINSFVAKTKSNTSMNKSLPNGTDTAKRRTNVTSQKIFLLFMLPKILPTEENCWHQKRRKIYLNLLLYFVLCTVHSVLRSCSNTYYCTCYAFPYVFWREGKWSQDMDGICQHSKHIWTCLS